MRFWLDYDGDAPRRYWVRALDQCCLNIRINRMRTLTIIMLVATLFPIVGPLLLFFSCAGIAVGAGMVVEHEKQLFGLATIFICSASLYAVAQLFSLSIHFIKNPNVNPEPGKLKHNTYGLIVGYACYLLLPAITGQYGLFPLVLGAPVVLLAIFFHLAIWHRKRRPSKLATAFDD